MALPTVLVTVLILLVLVGGTVAQAKAELRAARLEQDIAQTQVILASAMDQASSKVFGNPTWATGDTNRFPDPLEGRPSGWQPCDPQPMVAGLPASPAFCVDYLQRYDAATTFVGNNGRTILLDCATTDPTRGLCGVIPMRIRYKLKTTDTEIQQAYGWLLVQFTDTNRNVVRSVRTYLNHKWCQPNLNPDRTVSCG